MDAISYSHSAKQAKRIKKFINEPDSSSGVVTVPKVIASGETITIPAGRMAVLPNIQVDGTLNVQGDVFIPSGATMSKVVEKVTSTDNAVVRFNGTTGDVQNSGVIIDDNNTVKTNTFETIGETKTHRISTDSNVGGTNAFRISRYSIGGAFESVPFMIDASGNVGIGVTPSAWSAGKAIEIGYAGNGLFSNTQTQLFLGTNYNYNTDWKYTSNNPAMQYRQTASGHQWNSAPSGTAGNVITWTYAMTLDVSGKLTTSQQGITPDAGNISNQLGSTFILYQVSSFAANAANSAMKVGKDSTTSRSINAGGTINTSGADYAEYEYSNDITLVKGQIVGFKADGTLTDKYSEAIRFAIKSTNPSIVGGDTWGIEEIVGKRPERPVKSEEMTDEEFAELEELYELELADFEVRLEVERQKVDRIAYAGKVPVNVYGAVAGQYVIAVEKDGGIDGKLVNKSDMTFAEYQDAVGRVNKILDDGRAEVAVIIH